MVALTLCWRQRGTHDRPVAPTFLLLLCLSLFGQHSAAQDDCLAQQNLALRKFYEDTGGPGWESQNYWLQPIPGGCNISAVGNKSNVVKVPDHCCWEGVMCCPGQYCDPYFESIPECGCKQGRVTRLTLTWNNLRGQFPMDSLRDLNCGAPEGDFRKLELHNNNLTGTLPADISSLDGLWTLGLGYNELSGSLPPSISEIRTLKELDLTANTPGFSGRVPEGLCQGDINNSNITDIMISHNRFSEDLSIESCNSLVMLDAQNNYLSGSLPQLSGYNNMHMLRLGNNQLSGKIPPSIEKAPLMTVFYLPFNSLTGPLPSEIGEFTYLTSLNLVSNQLTGTIPDEIFKNLGSLQTLWLSLNKLNGTISSLINNSRSLADIDLSSNSLYGTIPDEMEAFAELGFRVDLRFNFFSCCGVNFNGTVDFPSYEYFNWTLYEEKPLPSFLAFSKFLVPVSEKGFLLTNMKCPMVHARDQEDTVVALLNFKIDPEYYLYKHCRCEQGYHMENQSANFNMWYGNIPTKLCVPDYESFFMQYPWVLAIIVLFATLVVLAGLVWFTCLRPGANRPAVVQSWINMQKRLRGEPTGGSISMVVTDIEGYSNLMKEAPELMTSALNIHNNVLRKARWTNFGYTVEQEGDSFALVFYEAVDAVMFCLQTQQALMKQAWPDGLFKEEQHEDKAVAAAHMRRVAANSIFSSIATAIPSLRKRKSTASASGIDGQPMGINSETQMSVPSESRFPESNNPSTSVARPQGDSMTGLDPDATEVEQEIYHGGPEEHNGPQLSTSALESGPSAEAVNTSAPKPGKAVTAKHPVPEGKAPVMFCGLRVRMGVATGELKKGSQIRGCKVMEKCKVISDAGAGGQVIIDEATFVKVKDRLHELGAVDQNGINYTTLNKNPMRSPWYMCMFWKRNTDEYGGMAPVLDMGTYIYSQNRQLPPINLTGCSEPKQISRIASFMGKKKCSESDSKTSGSSIIRRGNSSRRSIRTAKADKASSKVEEPMHLYQVLPLALSHRAKHFGNTLALKEEYVCVDPPYFVAPGTMEAPFGDPILPNMADPIVELPNVTTAVVGIDGGSSYVYKNRKEAKVCHDLIVMVVRNVLRQVPGGYLCSMCEKSLSYQLAFPSPQSALAWCLMAQECLLYMDWPESALLQWVEERDANSNFLFRGPRFKMAFTCGRPKSITPNKMGLPEYTGSCVASARRYMTYAAHRGQIVCEESLAFTAITALKESSPAHRGDGIHPSVGSTGNVEGSTHVGNALHLPSVEEDLDPSAILLQEVPASGKVLPPIPDAASLLNGGGAGNTASVAPPKPPLKPQTPVVVQPHLQGAPTTELLLQWTVPCKVEATSLGIMSLKGSKEQVALASVVLSNLSARTMPSDLPKGARRHSGSVAPLINADIMLTDVLAQYRSHSPNIPSLVECRSSGFGSASARWLQRSMTNRDSILIARKSSTAGVPVLPTPPTPKTSVEISQSSPVRKLSQEMSRIGSKTYT